MADPVYRTSPNVVATTLKDSESVLLDVNSRRYYSLNATGTRIWQLLGDDGRVSEIAAALASEYEVSEEEAREHVSRLLGEFRAEGLIDEVSEGSRP